MAPHIPNLGARREWPTSSSGRFTAGKEQGNRPTGSCCRPHSVSPHFGENKNLFFLPEYETGTV